MAFALPVCTQKLICWRIQHPPRKPALLEKLRFNSANFPYNPQKDEFTCPAGYPMLYMETRKHHTENGYLTERRYYESAHCEGCPLKPQCTKAKGNRRIQVSFKLKAYQQQAKANLLSEQDTFALLINGNPFS
jgi:hypothetical protein